MTGGRHVMQSFVFVFNDTATTEIYTLSLHDALPISTLLLFLLAVCLYGAFALLERRVAGWTPRSTSDRKSTRLNSSHANISYAVFCLKKKKDHTYYPISSHPMLAPFHAVTTICTSYF